MRVTSLDIPAAERHIAPKTDGALTCDMFASPVQPPRAESSRNADQSAQTCRPQPAKTRRKPRATARPISYTNPFG